MGSSLDEVPNATTIWSAGGTAEVSYAIWASHGGGIQFRLCPKTVGFPTEACFRTMPLAFATGVSKIRYTDGEREDLVIGAVDVNEGTTPVGSTWYVHRGGRGAAGARPLPFCERGGERHVSRGLTRLSFPCLLLRFRSPHHRWRDDEGGGCQFRRVIVTPGCLAARHLPGTQKPISLRTHYQMAMARTRLERKYVRRARNSHRQRLDCSASAATRAAAGPRAGRRRPAPAAKTSSFQSSTRCACRMRRVRTGSSGDWMASKLHKCGTAAPML